MRAVTKNAFFKIFAVKLLALLAPLLLEAAPRIQQIRLNKDTKPILELKLSYDKKCASEYQLLAQLQGIELIQDTKELYLKAQLIEKDRTNKRKEKNCLTPEKTLYFSTNHSSDLPQLTPGQYRVFINHEHWGDFFIKKNSNQIKVFTKHGKYHPEIGIILP